MIRKIIYFGLILSFVLVSCNSQEPKIIVETPNFDMGDVVNGEIVTWEVVVRNDGDAPLIVDTVSTSCGCTTASLDPMTIQPGSNATLTIEFDSGAHGPELTGTLTRLVFIESNDPNQPEVEVEFTANVVAKE
jgi:hypothetical protein